VLSSAVPFRGLRVGMMLRARAATSRGVGLAAAAGLVGPRCRRRAGYWLPRCGGRQRPGAVFHAPGAMRRVSSPSKILHLQVETLSTRPARLRTGREIALPPPPMRPASSPGVSKMPLRRYQRAASGPGGCRRETMPAFGQGDATLPGAFRPCRSSRLRRFAPLRAAQGPRRWGPRSALAEPAPADVSPATDPGVHAVSAPAALSALSRSVQAPFGVQIARIGRGGPRSQVRPRSCRTLRSVSLVSSRPVVTDERFLLAGSGRCAGRRHRYELCSPAPLASAGREALLRCRVRRQGRCRQRSCPDAPMGLVLERAGGRCFRGD
jgi:hypothetical protein